MRDTKQQRAIRDQVNARLLAVEQDLAALIRFCPPTELSSARRLLARAAKVLHDARIPPGQVAAWAADAESSQGAKKRQVALFADDVASALVSPKPNAVAANGSR